MTRPAVLMMLAVAACRSRPDAQAPTAPTAPTPTPPAPAIVVNPAGRAARDEFRKPDRVVAALGIRPGQRVADIGAGSGYLTFRLADAVGPTGRVVATDIDDAALGALRAHTPARPNVVVRKVAPDDPGLEPGSFDLVLLSEVDQYLPDRVDFLKRVRPALARGGRIAVTNRHPFREPLVAAAGLAGYRVAGEVTDLPIHYLLFLEPSPR